MRVCLISREYPPDTGWGGIATFAYHLAHGLTELGHDVEVVSLAKDKAHARLHDGILVHRVTPHMIMGDLGAISMCMPYSRYVIRTTSALWKKFLELHQEKPFDVIDSPELLAEGLVPAITKTAPLVVRLYTPHSKFIAERLHSVKPSFDHEFVAALERIAMQLADVITSPSQDLADYVAGDLNYPISNIEIVRNPIDVKKFCPEGKLTLESDGRLTVLFVGRLEERKGIEHLVKAVPEIVQQYGNVRFVIIGDDTNNGKGQKSMLAQLKADIKANDCGKHFIFIPRVPLEDLPAYYRSADICVVPSLYDNSPYTCLEAMSCGKPVVGTSAGGTAEYVVNGESGIIVPPKDSSALASAIVTLLKDSELRRAMGASARKRSVDKFQRSEIARQTVLLYEQAKGQFSQRQGDSLYLHDPVNALHDADALLYTMDKMLYDMMYDQSFFFRVRHWWRLATTNPKLMIAKSLLALARRVNAVISKSGRDQSAWLDKIAHQIELKQFPEIMVDPFEDLFKADFSEEALVGTAQGAAKG